MNIANKLTIARVALVPILLILLYLNIPLNFLWALLIFVAASLTDVFDGVLARKRGLVTDFGKFLDPLADKILVTAALIAFVGFGLAHPVAVVLVVAREFMVSGIRLIAASGHGVVIAANWWGKIKTTLQTTVIIAAMTFFELSRIMNNERLMDWTVRGSRIGMWVIAGFTVISGVVYLKENWQIVTRSI